MAATKNQFTTIGEYIESFPGVVKDRLLLLHRTIKETAPESQETIKYNMPTYVWHGNLVYFAAWKNHISLYPVTAEMEASFEELANYKTSGKGTVQFRHDQPLPVDLVRKMVEMRVKENLENR